MFLMHHRSLKVSYRPEHAKIPIMMNVMSNFKLYLKSIHLNNPTNNFHMHKNHKLFYLYFEYRPEGEGREQKERGKCEGKETLQDFM
jgi:hypothetical protein